MKTKTIKYCLASCAVTNKLHFSIRVLSQMRCLSKTVSVVKCSTGCSVRNYVTENDGSYFFNKMAANRKPSELREIATLVAKLPASAINLGVGYPDVNTFPFNGISFELVTGECIKLSDKELAVALQYLPSLGYNLLLNKLKEIQDYFHGPQDWNTRGILITCGAQEGLSKSVDMFMQHGDPVIVPQPAYAQALDLFRAYEPDFIRISQDANGVVVDEMQNALKTRKLNNQPMPKVMYLNPTGSNPAGNVIADSRKREIYQLACQYNIVILEDDPYYFLNFLEKNPASFLSMDTEGRVIRLDSFSKVMSSGLRLGFATGSASFIRKMELAMQNSSLHPSSLSQIMAYKLLVQWGIEGLKLHFERVKKYYRQKRDHMLRAVEQNLSGLAEWYEPTGGMFLWLKIKGLEDTRHLVTSTCLAKMVIFAPGFAFATDTKKPSPYIRISYSVASTEEIDKGIALLAEAIREELKSIKTQ
ncbi:kynurenine/alpha-aminoadipate aminotransferase, mitochondrial-like [Adelges cooleyi]|uniref:kynurenine/alpha-aminoadipate aminotransferase, mitochondrial-like n=1 Tax=Adelges cooleyi TaxID=133065 RepID=UPI00217F5FC5|nr:kynurenine/alpha-aminoadipate aminotransferase, mitochondrial-like [Adelges cooleyi]XP_050430901.1 kynurenine/alpha-aminoadipate aminotransferase, mitochondrial-like [Adelges cooleyi]